MVTAIINFAIAIDRLKDKKIEKKQSDSNNNK